MNHWSKNYETMKLTAFDIREVEAVNGGFRYRHGLRAVLARLAARISQPFKHPSNRA